MSKSTLLMPCGKRPIQEGLITATDHPRRGAAAPQKSIVYSRNKLLVSDYLYSLEAGAREERPNTASWPGPSKEPAMFIGLIIIIILLAIFLGMRRRRR